MSYHILNDLHQQLLVAVNETSTFAVESIIKSLRVKGMIRSDLTDAFFAAIKTKEKKLVQILIRNGAEITSTDRNGYRPIHQAVKSGSEEITKIILNGGSPVNITDSIGATPLHFAVEFNHYKIACLLVREGANINRSRLYDTRETPMHYAAKFGRTEIVKILLNNGADPNLQTNSGETAVHLAVRNHNFGAVEVLCNAQTNLDVYNKAGQTPLLIAVSNNRVHLIKGLLDCGAQPNFPDKKQGLTALHYTARNHPAHSSHGVISSICISHGADPNQRNNEGETPLHLAARCGNKYALQILLQCGANANARTTSHGFTPLLEAVERSQTEVVRLLLEAGADVNLCSNSGKSALHIPDIGVHNTETLDLLISYGAKLNKQNNAFETPLNCCIFYSFIRNRPKENLKKLIAAGASLKKMSKKRSKEGQPSPLCWLTWHGDLEAAEFLVNAGWNVNNEQNWLALSSQKTEVEEFLIVLRSIATTPSSLKSMCRSVIREHLLLVSEDTSILPFIQSLPLPRFLKQYMSLDNCM